MNVSSQKVDTGAKIISIRDRGAFSVIVKLQSPALLHMVSGVCTEHALPGENCSQPGVRSEHLIRSQLQPRQTLHCDCGLLPSLDFHGRYYYFLFENQRRRC